MVSQVSFGHKKTSINNLNGDCYSDLPRNYNTKVSLGAMLRLSWDEEQRPTRVLVPSITLPSFSQVMVGGGLP